MDNFIIGSGIICLVPFFTTIGVAASLKNYPILSGRSIQSFRHLELKNLSIISNFRHRTGWCKNSGGAGGGAAAAGGGVQFY